MAKLSEKEPKREYKDYNVSLNSLIVRFKDIYVKYSEKFDEVPQGIFQSIEQKIN